MKEVLYMAISLWIVTIAGIIGMFAALGRVICEKVGEFAEWLATIGMEMEDNY